MIYLPIRRGGAALHTAAGIVEHVLRLTDGRYGGGVCERELEEEPRSGGGVELFGVGGVGQYGDLLFNGQRQNDLFYVAIVGGVVHAKEVQRLDANHLKELRVLIGEGGGDAHVAYAAGHLHLDSLEQRVGDAEFVCRGAGHLF